MICDLIRTEIHDALRPVFGDRLDVIVYGRFSEQRILLSESVDDQELFLGHVQDGWGWAVTRRAVVDLLWKHRDRILAAAQANAQSPDQWSAFVHQTYGFALSEAPVP